MKVKQAMHKGVQWLQPDAPLKDVAKLMRDHDIGSVPVGENDKLIGFVTDRDIVCRGLADGHDIANLKARDVMSNGVTYCSEDDDLDDATDVMEQKKIRRLIVLDANKRMTGILSIGDVSHFAPKGLCGEVVKAVAQHHS